MDKKINEIYKRDWNKEITQALYHLMDISNQVHKDKVKNSRLPHSQCLCAFISRKRIKQQSIIITILRTFLFTQFSTF